MQIYDTERRAKREFAPREEGHVRMYVCGPTVYDQIHIGNGRTFVAFDAIRRYLEAKGYDVTFVQNLTDVDDKIINRAAEEGRSAAEVASEYSDAFREQMRRMGVEPPSVQPKATEEIPQMIALIEELVEGGHAYATPAGDVYFSVSSCPTYGEVSGRRVEDLLAGARVEVDEDKRESADFALWKAAKPGEPSWESPWGAGRPAGTRSAWPWRGATSACRLTSTAGAPTSSFPITKTRTPRPRPLGARRSRTSGCTPGCFASTARR